MSRPVMGLLPVPMRGATAARMRVLGGISVGVGVRSRRLLAVQSFVPRTVFLEFAHVGVRWLLLTRPCWEHCDPVVYRVKAPRDEDRPTDEVADDRRCLIVPETSDRTRGAIHQADRNEEH